MVTRARAWRTAAMSAMSALAALALVLSPGVRPALGAAPLPAPELTLSAALLLMPDTPATRTVGVWYADYAAAERTYGVTGVVDMGDARIARLFAALLPLRPGPETGAALLTQGVWRQSYGYDLLNLTSEIYTRGAAQQPLAMATGSLDLGYIAHVLATAGYIGSVAGQDRLLVRVPLLPLWASNAPMNAVAFGPRYLIAGARPADVAMAALRTQQGRATLGRDNGYRALATALGPVQGAYLAANVPVPPYGSPRFTRPPSGHGGPALHPFDLYAVAYLEPRPGLRYLELALTYTRRADALADAPTLRSRLLRESLPVSGASWSGLVDGVRATVRGSVLLVRLRPRSSTSPTLWQDVVVEGDLSLLSR